MKQTSDDYLREQDRLQQLVQRYENSLTSDGNLTTWFDSEDIEDICNVYVDAGDLKKANDALKVGLQMHPTDSALQMLRAHLLIEEYKPEEALILLKQLNFTKEFYWHYLCLGAYADLGIWQNAESEAEEALKYDGDRVAASLDVARVFYDRGKIKEALRYLLRAEKTNPNEMELWEAIIQCYADLNQAAEALPYVEKMIDADPYSVGAWQIKASLHISLDQYNLALEDYEYALAIDPEDETTIISKIKLLILLDKEDEAQQVMSIMRQKSDFWARTCMMLEGDMWYLRHDYPKAHTCYFRGYRPKSFLGESTLHYIECKMYMHRWRGVIQVGNNLLKYTPDDLKLLEMMADAYFELRRYDQCAQMLRRCLDLEPENVYMLLRYGSLLLDKHDVDAAYEIIKKAWDLSPELSHTNLLMAVVYHLRGDDKQMYDYLQEACRINPESRETFLQLCPRMRPYVGKSGEPKRGRTKK